MKKITCADAVGFLKRYKLSWPAATIACMLDTDSRAVATALRAAVKDGRVKMTYRKIKNEQRRGYYRFIRLKAKV